LIYAVLGLVKTCCRLCLRETLGGIPSPRRFLRDVGHELFVHPLESPTGPHGAKNFRNVAGSQIAVPHVTNVYLGEFWAGVEQRAFFEQFSKAIVENGYLDPLTELGHSRKHVTPRSC
jgi:hypothetical protein